MQRLGVFAAGVVAQMSFEQEHGPLKCQIEFPANDTVDS